MFLVLSVAVVITVVPDDTATRLLPTYFGNVAQWVAALVPLLALLLAAISARWAAKQWRLQYFTKEWSNTVQFLIANSEFMNPDTNKEYRVNYKGDKLVKYELVARISIAYVDDLYYLGTGKYFENWLRGSVKVFVHPHRWWFRENSDSYAKEFVKYITDSLPT